MPRKVAKKKNRNEDPRSGQGETGLLPEPAGMQAYRKAVWRRVEEKVAKVEAEVAAAAARRAKERTERLAKRPSKKK